MSLLPDDQRTRILNWIADERERGTSRETILGVLKSRGVNPSDVDPALTAGISPSGIPSGDPLAALAKASYQRYGPGAQTTDADQELEALTRARETLQGGRKFKAMTGAFPAIPQRALQPATYERLSKGSVLQQIQAGLQAAPESALTLGGLIGGPTPRMQDLPNTLPARIAEIAGELAMFKATGGFPAWGGIMEKAAPRVERLTRPVLRKLPLPLRRIGEVAASQVAPGMTFAAPVALGEQIASVRRGEGLRPIDLLKHLAMGGGTAAALGGGLQAAGEALGGLRRPVQPSDLIRPVALQPARIPPEVPKIAPEAPIAAEARLPARPAPEAAVAKPEAAKEPWEMTQDEFDLAIPVRPVKGSPNEWVVQAKGVLSLRGDMKVDQSPSQTARRRFVMRAVEEGKSVPPSVLADYPDLAAKYGKAAPALVTEGEAAAQRAKTEIPEVEPPALGLSLRITGRPQEQPAPGFQFSDPQTEARYRAAKIPPKPSAWQQLKSVSEYVVTQTTRTFPTMPRIGKFAQVHFDLVKLRKQKAISGQKVAGLLQDVLAPLRQDKAAEDLFQRKVLVDDAMENLTRGQIADELPFGFTPASLPNEAARIDAILANSPSAVEALRRFRAHGAEATDVYIKAMQDIGFDPSKRLTREKYLRHLVLDYLEAERIVGVSRRGVHAATSRGFLKERIANPKDYLSDVIKAQWEVLSQMDHDVAVARFLKGIQESDLNLAPGLKLEAAEKKVDWHSLVPADHGLFQAREGNVFFLAKSIPEKYVDEAIAMNLAEVGIPIEKVRDALAMGGKFKEMVLPQEVIGALETFNRRSLPGPIGRGARAVNRAWKQWQLISPYRWLNYNLRNETGDASKVLRGNPSTFLPQNMKDAAADLYQAFRTTRPPTGNLKEWMDRGGPQGLLQAQEMGQIDDLRRLVGMLEGAQGIPAKIGEVWQRYWRAARLSTDAREAFLRYATNLDYIRQMERNPGGPPNNFGASKPEEVMALRNIYDRGYKLSNELLGAYDQVSPFTQWLRENLVPFASWWEVNPSAEKGLLLNAIRTRQTGRYVLGKAPAAAVGIAGYAVKIAALFGAVQVWNALHSEAEAKLPAKERSRPHLTFGEDAEGNPQVLWRIGDVPDILDWFGLDTAPYDVKQVLNGHLSFKDWMKQTAISPIEKAILGVGPQYKTVAELVTGRALYPKPFERRPIRDPALQIAQGLGLGGAFAKATGRPIPQVGGGNILPRLKPGTPVRVEESAYYEIQELKAQFRQQILKKEPMGAGDIGAKGTSAWNLRKAIRFGDEAAMRKYAKQYQERGGTIKGLRQSIRNADPLFGLRGYTKEFEGWLDKDGQDKLRAAQGYYDSLKKNAAKAYGHFAIPPPFTMPKQ